MLDRVTERRRAAQLARHYRDQEGLSIAEIARRLGRAEATIKAYLYDPTGDKARAVKARYRGVCRGCGAPTAPRNGKGDAYAYCKRCHPGAIAPQWTRERVREAMRAWRARYGAAPSSYDWSRTHARRRGGEALKRLQAGEWPAPSTVIDLYGAGRRPSPTPSAAPERSGVNAVDIRTRACAWPSVNGSAEGRRERFCHSSLQQQPGRRRPVTAGPGKRQRRALASRRGSGRRQAPRRLSQPRQSGAVDPSCRTRLLVHAAEGKRVFRPRRHDDRRGRRPPRAPRSWRSWETFIRGLSCPAYLCSPAVSSPPG